MHSYSYYCKVTRSHLESLVPAPDYGFMCDGALLAGDLFSGTIPHTINQWPFLALSYITLRIHGFPESLQLRLW